jgi:hypothetical protein
MSLAKALASGLAGAAALTGVHESARKNVPNAPRMDVLGMRALEKIADAMGVSPPSEKRLHELALVGDVAANALYYSLIALGRRDRNWVRGAALGLAAGVGAVALPGILGLGTKPSRRTYSTAAMTVGWYLIGGLAAAGVNRLMADRSGPDEG